MEKLSYKIQQNSGFYRVMFSDGDFIRRFVFNNVWMRQKAKEGEIVLFDSVAEAECVANDLLKIEIRNTITHDSGWQDITRF